MRSSLKKISRATNIKPTLGYG